MTKITALIDGSVYASSVCDHAAWIAGRTQVGIELLHVIGRRDTSSEPANLSGNIALGARSALLEELSALDEARAKLAQKRGRAILEDAKARLVEAGVDDVSMLLRIGDVVETAAEFEAQSEMLVIGKRGEAADFAKLHLGSNLERVVRAAKKQVFVASRAFKPIQKLLIAYDGGTSSMMALDHVARSPLYAGLDCHLVTVGPDTPENTKKLDDARRLLEGGGYDVTSRLLPGEPHKVISGIVEEEGIDLLIMGAYGHNRIRNLIIGSTTTEMIRSCKIPVVLYR
ncbi:universal stress protein [Chelativorans xinjiangense]|uniref:universal stress protein n=1 Tax=Chelativorans xinjiangense TaxID=2681485 RepID=UPI001357D45C|nr:universal stress protein [Chelativorans xinjiangense]